MPRSTLYAVLLVSAVAWLACSPDLVTPSTHVLVGNAYDPANSCLSPQQSFDVVDGPAPEGSCDVVCITDAKTGTAYVTNACPPYPVLDTVESGDAGEAGADPCTAALAAWAAGQECGASDDASDDASPDATPEGAPGDAADAGDGASAAATEAGGDAS